MLRHVTTDKTDKMLLFQLERLYAKHVRTKVINGTGDNTSNWLIQLYTRWQLNSLRVSFLHADNVHQEPKGNVEENTAGQLPKLPSSVLHRPHPLNPAYH